MSTTEQAYATVFDREKNLLVTSIADHQPNIMLRRKRYALCDIRGLGDVDCIADVITYLARARWR